MRDKELNERKTTNRIMYILEKKIFKKEREYIQRQRLPSHSLANFMIQT